MAEPNGPSATGSSPFEGTPGIPGQPAAAPGHVPAVKIDMGLAPPPAVRRAPEPARPGAGAMVLVPSLLALLFGGAGAWAYERFAPRQEVTKPAEPANPPAADGRAQQELAQLTDRINELEAEYKHIDARLESLSKQDAGGNVKSLERKVARLDELSARVEALGRTLDPLPHQVEQLGQKVTGLDKELEERGREETSAAAREITAPGPVRATMATRPNRPLRDDQVEPAEHDASERAKSVANSDSKSEAPSDNASLDDGIKQFRDRHYSEAYDTFRKLMFSQPDDARVWYYGALSYGLASRDWGRLTEMMAREGAAREKAGKPARPVIDESLAGLTKETGKEWLDFFRRRAR